MMKSPFDFIKIITYTKENINFEDNKKYYIPFIINRGLSLHLDCVLLSNEMNLNSHLDIKLQYDFYFDVIRKKKRYSKWNKRNNMEELKMISQKYKCNIGRAKEIFNILQLYK